MVKRILKKFEPRQREMFSLYQRYTATDVPIFRRAFRRKEVVNNRLNNDYLGEIVDMKTGYFAGNPISYNYSKDVTGYKEAQDLITRFSAENNLPDLDVETTKMAAICGYGARLMYIDELARERAKNLPAYGTVFLANGGDITEPDYALYVYVVLNERDSPIRKVEFYGDTYTHYFIETRSNSGTYRVEKPPDPHQFTMCPVVGFPNNAELQGDAEKVLALIDAIDRTMSDVNSEIEAFRLAYMAFVGGSITEDALAEAVRLGAFNVPEGGDIKFIVKELNDTAIENHLNRLHDNIYRFSKTPDLSDEAFGSGSQSGEARKYKLLGLEMKTGFFENKFRSASKRMFELLAGTWNLKTPSLNFDPLNVWYEFKRNFPKDLLYEAQATQQLKGMVSEQTRLSQLSFVDDAQYEIELMQREREDIPDLELGDEDDDG
ncbi:phage portal protein [Paenibacillus sp. 32O-W]|uniref:phage portal protein n=1 Tax=Paenibacillus sp. 32O-W TaxID=1695218 RepID=UPI0011AEB9B6|nr:phage portal protein [Paenibacillus sp. 32O-W]